MPHREHARAGFVARSYCSQDISADVVPPARASEQPVVGAIGVEGRMCQLPRFTE